MDRTPHLAFALALAFALPLSGLAAGTAHAEPGDTRYPSAEIERPLTLPDGAWSIGLGMSVEGPPGPDGRAELIPDLRIRYALTDRLELEAPLVLRYRALGDGGGTQLLLAAGLSGLGWSTVDDLLLAFHLGATVRVPLGRLLALELSGALDDDRSFGDVSRNDWTASGVVGLIAQIDRRWSAALSATGHDRRVLHDTGDSLIEGRERATGLRGLLRRNGDTVDAAAFGGPTRTLDRVGWEVGAAVTWHP